MLGFVRVKPGRAWPSTPRKPSTKWCKILPHYHPGSDDIPVHVAWLWKVAKRIDADESRTGWWSTASIPILELQPVLYNAPETTRFDQDQNFLRVEAGAAALEAYVLKAVNSRKTDLTKELPDDLKHLLLDLVTEMTRATADHLHLDPPPEVPSIK